MDNGWVSYLSNLYYYYQDPGWLLSNLNTNLLLFFSDVLGVCIVSIRLIETILSPGMKKEGSEREGSVPLTGKNNT